MKPELDSILEQSLSQLASGKAGVEGALPSDPALAGELKPLLRTAETVMSAPKPVLPAEASARIESQLLEAAAANPRLRPTQKPSIRVTLPQWRRAYSALTAVVLALFLTMASLVGASADTLPGAALYPLKLATEDAWLWVAPARDEPALHLRFAHRRLSESQALLDQGKLDPAALDNLDRHATAALQGLAALPPESARLLLEELQEFTSVEQHTLSAYLDRVPLELRGHLETAIVAGDLRVDLIGTVAELLTPPETADLLSTPVASTPAPTSTLTPTHTPKPTETPVRAIAPAAANTSTNTPTATATSTSTSTATATATSTPTPTSTSTPTPTSTSTSTSTPTPTATNTPTQTATPAPTSTKTPTPTATPTSTATPAPTSVPTRTNTPTPTSTPRPTFTSTSTSTPSPTSTNTPRPTSTPTNTPVPTSTPTSTNTPLPTSTDTPRPTSTPTNTPSPTNTPTDTPEPTETLTPTRTPRPTKTPKPTKTPRPDESPGLSQTPDSATAPDAPDALSSLTEIGHVIYTAARLSGRFFLRPVLSTWLEILRILPLAVSFP